MSAERGAPRPGASLEQRLGYGFTDPALLSLALTHGSARGDRPGSVVSNERLEFLGDRVLGLVVAELLYRRFTDEPEGALAQRHAALVSRPTLTRVAERLHLSPSIVASRSEREAGGTSNPGMLADTCEAIIGAMFLDGGLAAAAAFIEAQWSAFICDTLTPPKDPKTALQEWAQGRSLGLPNYREVKRHGPAHAPEFWIEVDVPGAGTAIANGATKRAAEQAAAEELLGRLQRGG